MGLGGLGLAMETGYTCHTLLHERDLYREGGGGAFRAITWSGRALACSEGPFMVVASHHHCRT